VIHQSTTSPPNSTDDRALPDNTAQFPDDDSWARGESGFAGREPLSGVA
jgi:hypothetical protein